MELSPSSSFLQATSIETRRGCPAGGIIKPPDCEILTPWGLPLPIQGSSPYLIALKPTGQAPGKFFFLKTGVILTIIHMPAIVYSRAE